MLLASRLELCLQFRPRRYHPRVSFPAKILHGFSPDSGQDLPCKGCPCPHERGTPPTERKQKHGMARPWKIFAEEPSARPRRRAAAAAAALRCVPAAWAARGGPLLSVERREQRVLAGGHLPTFNWGHTGHPHPQLQTSIVFSLSERQEGCDTSAPVSSSKMSLRKSPLAAEFEGCPFVRRNFTPQSQTRPNRTLVIADSYFADWTYSVPLAAPTLRPRRHAAGGAFEGGPSWARRALRRRPSPSRHSQTCLREFTSALK